MTLKPNQIPGQSITQHQDKVQYQKTLYGVKQLISARKHFILNSLCCLDLTFVNQPNLVTDFDNHLSQQQNCHYQVIFYKLNLKTEYPPKYGCSVWDYRKAQTHLIDRAIDQLDLVTPFLGKDINKQVILFSRTKPNIFHNFIPNKVTVCDHRDHTWINDRIEYPVKKEKNCK